MDAVQNAAERTRHASASGEQAVDHETRTDHADELERESDASKVCELVATRRVHLCKSGKRSLPCSRCVLMNRMRAHHKVGLITDRCHKICRGGKHQGVGHSLAASASTRGRARVRKVKREAISSGSGGEAEQQHAPSRAGGRT